MRLNRFFKIVLTSPDAQTSYVVDGTANMGISEGTMHLEEILFSDQLEFGACNSNRFEIQIFGLSEDVSGYSITVTNDYNPSDPEPIFRGTVESSKTDNKNGYRNIIAYDNMYFVRDMNVAPWWNQFWITNHDRDDVTLRELRESLVSFAGFDIVPSPIFENDYQPIKQFAHFTAIKFGVLLKILCEAQLITPNVARDGRMEFISFQDVNWETAPLLATLDNDGADYDKNRTEFEDYRTVLPTGFHIYSSSNDLAQIVPEDENNTNGYIFSGNLLFLSMTGAEINNFLTPELPTLQKFIYTPATVPMIYSSLGLKLGQAFVINRGGQRLQHFIMSQTFSGPQLVEQEINCVAHGRRLSTKVSAVNDEVVEGQRYAKLSQDVEGLHADVYDAETGQTKVEILAKGVESTVSDINGQMSKVTQTMDGLHIITEDGESFINGNRIITDTLMVNYLFPKSGSHANFTEMQDAGIAITLGSSGQIFMGYTNRESGNTNQSLPYLKLGTDDLDPKHPISCGIIKRYPRGIWIGDEEDLLGDTIQSGTGLYIDFTDNKLYKYVKGERFAIADDQTMIAKFG